MAEVDIDLLSLGPVSVGTRAWGYRGRCRLTAIVKLSFSLEPDSPMKLMGSPSELVVREVPRSANPVTSALRASEVAPFVRRAEVLVDGIAFAPQPAEQSKARLAIVRGERILLSKELRVLGDRVATGEPPRPTPFTKMPIVYERALGGLGSADNPVGIGMEMGGKITMPNIVGGEGARVEPFGFGPISAAWPARRNKRGAMQRQDLEEGVWIDIPEGFDESYYQSAPLDQQVDDFAPGDQILMAGMHPTLPSLRVMLAHVRGVAIAEAPNGRQVPIPMRLDTIHLEPHAMRADLIFRGVIEMPKDLLRGMRVAGAAEELPTVFRFPALGPLVAKARKVRPTTSITGAMASPPAAAAVSSSSTMLLDEDAPPAAVRPALPLGHGAPPPLPAPPPPAPMVKGRAGVVFGTMPLPVDPAASADQPASMPFKGGKRRRSSMKMPAVQQPPKNVPANVVPARPGVMATMVIDAEPAPAPPPRIAMPEPPPPVAAQAPPEEPLSIGRYAMPVSAKEPAKADVDAESERPSLADILANKPAPPPSSPVAAPPPPPSQPKAAVWAQPTNELAIKPAAAPPAPRPVVAPAPDRKAQLYKKFKT